MFFLIPFALNLWFLNLAIFAKRFSFEKSLFEIRFLAIPRGFWGQVLIGLLFLHHFYQKNHITFRTVAVLHLLQLHTFVEQFLSQDCLLDLGG